MVEEGVAAFWGYTVNFSFFHAHPSPVKLDTDSLAKAFILMDVVVLKGILDGHPSERIMNAVGQYFNKVYPQLKKPEHRAALLDNYLHLVCPSTNWGSPNAVI